MDVWFFSLISHLAFTFLLPSQDTFMDFVRFGGPLQILLAVITVAVVATLDYWWIWLLGLLICLILYTCLAPAKWSNRGQMQRTADMWSAGQLPMASRPGHILFYQPDLGLSPMEKFDDEDVPSVHSPLVPAYSDQNYLPGSTAGLPPAEIIGRASQSGGSPSSGDDGGSPRTQYDSTV